MKKLIFILFMALSPIIVICQQINPSTFICSQLAVFSSEPNNQGDYTFINSQDSVSLIELVNSENWKAMYKAKIGYVNGIYFEKNAAYQAYKKLHMVKVLAKEAAEEKKKNDLAYQLATKAKAARKAALTKKYGSTIAIQILKGTIKLGWTKAMVLDSWGKPDDINRTVTSRLVKEQWVYGRNYVYFDNGILTAWQD